ncbi:MAG: stage III sporulation protein AA [Bacillota bacterium]
MGRAWEEDLLPLVAEPVRSALRRLAPETAAQLEEIRLRVARPLAVGSYGRETFVCSDGRFTSRPEEAYRVSRGDVEATLQLLFRGSLYAVEEQLRQGYVTVAGGHRVGFCGRAVLEDGHIAGLVDISSLSFRICREVPGAADPIIPFLVVDGRVVGALILSAPLGGKTTVLRDAVRQLSDGVPALRFPGAKVCLVDERSEVAGCWNGEPQRYVGLRTDVLDGVPKATGLMMAVRAMSPQVVATDELGGAADVAAVEEALHAGVAVLATAHASSLAEARSRPHLGGLMARGAFPRVILLSRRLGPGTAEAVWSAEGENLLPQPLPPGPWTRGHIPAGPAISCRKEGQGGA